MLYALLLITAGESFIVTAANDRPHVDVMALLEVASNFVAFVWYCRDSDAMGYKRSSGLNIAVILLGPFGVAFYLVRSRPKGKRLRAVLRLLGFVCLLVGASVPGTIIGAILT
ncbi:hypothetical protein HHL21_03160 [Massilia sp. RP-1-19]|uniref:Uncharacterized protein n=1 Tax=Massilia polaris TaxID=2728846 RepID=A0A848HIX6_9BURK|nr:hypothetical protein [Massilia polaris]NML60099.1 hypothetical protein [Massilia polaris]